MKDTPDKNYGNEETERRFLTALHGARLADATPMKNLVGKGPKSRVKKTAQAKPK
jgi:hypothetical protein